MKTKQFFLTAGFFLATLYINAQEKYEFAILEFNTVWHEMSFSTDEGFKVEVFKVAGKDFQNCDARPFLKKVKEFQEQKWEVMNFATQLSSPEQSSMGPQYEVYFAYLKRKLPETK